MKNLKNKVAVVTGASSGIGQAVALELARQGCDLALCSKSDATGLETTAQAIRDMGRRAFTARVDVADRNAVQDFAQSVVREFGQVHILVNNAGVGLVAPIETMEYEDFEWVMKINLWGVVHGTKAFLPHLQGHESHIVNVSSLWGLWAFPNQSAYTVSKFAIRGFTEALAQELHGSGVGVSLVLPGGVQTDIARKSSRLKASIGPFKDAQMLVKLFDLVALTSAEKAAKVMVKAVKKKKRRVLVGPDAKVLDLAQRMFPSFYQRVIPLFL